MEDYKNIDAPPAPEPVKKKHIVREYTESIFVAVILALIIRAFDMEFIRGNPATSGACPRRMT